MIEREVVESRGVRGCPCRICVPDDRSEWTNLDFDNAETIANSGWVVLSVTGPGPGWSYTIGLSHTIGTPELMIFGLQSDTRHFILNGIAQALRDGDIAHAEGLVPSGVGARNLPFHLKTLSHEWASEFGRIAFWLARNERLPFWQVVWTDREAAFPWDSEFDREFADGQPDGWLPPPPTATSPWGRAFAVNRWPTNGPAKDLAFVSVTVNEGREPVRFVKQFDDGDWSFLDGIGPYDSDAIVLVHLDHILESDPGLVDLIDLPPGFEAYRTEPGQQWEIEPTPDD